MQKIQDTAILHSFPQFLVLALRPQLYAFCASVKISLLVKNAWVQVLRPTRHKTGHFGDVLPSKSLG